MIDTAHEILRAKVDAARQALEIAERELIAYERAPERNVFDDLEVALEEMEDELLERARRDCEGSYAVGEDVYTQDFYVGKQRYQAWIEVEYNRWDKTYYYIYDHKFGHMEIEE